MLHSEGRKEEEEAEDEKEERQGGREGNQAVGIAENEENLNRVFTLLTHVDCDRWD